MHCPLFESAVSKIQGGQCQDLDEKEKSIVECFLISSPTSGMEEDCTESDRFSFAERLMKRRKVTRCDDVYCDTRFILPTTNKAERFFSKAGHSLSKRRKSINPEMFEAQMFLHFNKDVWDINDVNVVMK